MPRLRRGVATGSFRSREVARRTLADQSRLPHLPLRNRRWRRRAPSL